MGISDHIAFVTDFSTSSWALGSVGESAVGGELQFWLATIKFFHCICCSLSILYRLIYEVQPGVEASPQLFLMNGVMNPIYLHFILRIH